MKLTVTANWCHSLCDRSTDDLGNSTTSWMPLYRKPRLWKMSTKMTRRKVREYIVDTGWLTFFFGFWCSFEHKELFSLFGLQITMSVFYSPIRVTATQPARTQLAVLTVHATQAFKGMDILVQVSHELWQDVSLRKRNMLVCHFGLSELLEKLIEFNRLCTCK